MQYCRGLRSPGLYLPDQNHAENKLIITKKKSYLFSPRDRENIFLGKQAMCLCTIHLNTWMFILLEPSPFSPMLLRQMTAH